MGAVTASSVNIAQISIATRPLLLTSTIAGFGDDFDALAYRVATRTANTVRVFMLDWQLETSMHATPLLSITSPTNFQQTRAVHFPTRTAASPQGLGGFAALYPNRGKQKNLLLVYDMHHNFAFFLFSILQVSEPKNARTRGSLEQRRQDGA
jgi:hypothetical protein